MRVLSEVEMSVASGGNTMAGVGKDIQNATPPSFLLNLEGGLSAEDDWESPMA